MAYEMTSTKPRGTPRKSFTPGEDYKLACLVMLHGSSQWEVIARFMSGRNARQCRERWKSVLTPGLVNGPWSHAEDELLVRLFREHGPKWSMISKYFSGRSDCNVKNRWTRHLMLMKLDHFERKIPESHSKEGDPSDDFRFLFDEDQVDNCLVADAFINW
jgi:hypothetical protein